MRQRAAFVLAWLAVAFVHAGLVAVFAQPPAEGSIGHSVPPVANQLGYPAPVPECTPDRMGWRITEGLVSAEGVALVEISALPNTSAEMVLKSLRGKRGRLMFIPENQTR